MKTNCDVAKTCVHFYNRLKRQLLDADIKTLPCAECHYNKNVRETVKSFFKIYY